MQTITVKVCYKGKTLIVGKGISSVEQITKELAKRFPQVDQIKSSLTVGFQNGAEDLLSAYRIAEKDNKKFIKVKFSSGEQCDRSFISERPQDSCVISVLDPFEEKDNPTLFTKPQQAKPEATQKSEPIMDVFQNLDDRFEIAVNQKPIERKASSSQQTLMVEPQRNEQAKEAPISQIQVPDKLNNKVSEIKTSSEGMENPIDYDLLDDYFPSKEQTSTTLHLTKGSKKANFEKLFGLNQEKPQKKEQPLNPDAQAVLEIVRRQYDTKIKTLQVQYSDLKINYNILYSKYDQLQSACGLKNESKVQSNEQIEMAMQHKRKSAQDIGKLEKTFQQIWKEAEPKSEHLTNSMLKNCQPVQYFAEISEFSTIEYAIVGDMVQSTFRIKNVGMKKWPENIFAQQQKSQDFIDIKSLQANESAIVTLHTEKARNIGDNINKMYQLVYIDEKNNVRKFGRVFGISVKVIENKRIDPFFHNPKPNPVKPNDFKKTDPIIVFRSYISEIMQAKKLNSKSIYDVIGFLKDFGITAQNYKNCDAKTLTEFIKSICL